MSKQKVRITGSGGLTGSACAEYLANAGWEVAGIDNNLRQEFFGPSGSTTAVVTNLVQKYPTTYRISPLTYATGKRFETLLSRSAPL